MPRILITDYEFESISQEQAVADANGVELVRANCRTEDDVIEAAAEVDGLIVQYAPITERVLKGLPRLKAVSRYGVGVDTVDVQAATECGVVVSNVPDYGVEDVSDHAVALALTLARGIPDLDRGIRDGENVLDSVKPLRRFSSQTFGVIGLGLIGAATAAKAKALGFRALGYDPLHTPGTTTKEGIQVVTFDEPRGRVRRRIPARAVEQAHPPLDQRTHAGAVQGRGHHREHLPGRGD
ncbi:hypothetical protein NG819_07995 [Pseudarthrobacter sp. Fe7]|nr:hypothetical protein NG819_07995 [Pseudarthrobacter sp. Fe7]